MFVDEMDGSHSVKPGLLTTIFIVEDDDAVRDSLKMLLEFYGIAVEGYNSVQAFARYYRPGSRQCLVLDQHRGRGELKSGQMASTPYKTHNHILMRYRTLAERVLAQGQRGEDLLDQKTLDGIGSALSRDAPRTPPGHGPAPPRAPAFREIDDPPRGAFVIPANSVNV